MVLADNFFAQPITFKPAVAASAQGDENSFYECGFIGVQDTLHDLIGCHFFRSSYIQGAVDFIFGDGTSMYQACLINVTGYGFITAQRRETPEEQSRFVLKFTKVFGTGPTYLGRAYGPYSRVLRHCGSKGMGPLEVACRGNGANTSGRVGWEKTLSPAELKSLISTSFIDEEGWLREAIPPLSSSSYPKLHAMGELHLPRSFTF
ncbi:putative pectinesterase 52 [Vitis vinifera]|uniref:Pectinesterase n=1 Tax=Vitis vinifera TaxID=29760 RepID=A0A438G5G1_VITVI|nr:putative pectinesterase 52 [Vitis vinifera]